MKRLFFLLIALPLAAQTTGVRTGAFTTAIPAGIPATGLTHCYLPNGTPATLVDLCGPSGGNLATASGTMSGLAAPGWENYRDQLVLQKGANEPYYAWPGIPYAANTATGTDWIANSSAPLTFGDGNPHTLIYGYCQNPYQYNSSGNPTSGSTMFSKSNEYELTSGVLNGGAFEVNYGTSFTAHFEVGTIVPAANQFYGQAPSLSSQANIAQGCYIYRQTYDGSSNLCAGLNIGQATCVSGVTLATSGDFVLDPGVTPEFLLEYNSVLPSSNDTGATCTATSGTNQCIPDALYNSAFQNTYPWNRQQAPANAVTIQVNGSSYIKDNPWGTSYTTWQSNAVASGNYVSGLTATGTAGQTCILSSFYNGAAYAAGTTATVLLTTTGTSVTIGAQALVITAGGSNASAETSATASAGTASACSGTAVISGVTLAPNNGNRWYVPNPMSLFSIQTNGPSLTFNIATLNGDASIAGADANIGVWLDGSTTPYTIPIQAQQTGGQTVTMALPNDGATHTVTFNAASYVQTQTQIVSPWGNYTGMGATVVKSISCPGPQYICNPVTPTYSKTAYVIEDSLMGYLTNWPETDGFDALLRTNNSGGNVGDVIADGAGGMALYNDMGCNPGAGGGSSTTCTSTAWTHGSVSNTFTLTPAAYANKLKANSLATIGACPKYLIFKRILNDWTYSLWYSTDAEIAMGYFWTQWTTICPSSTNIQLGPTYRSNSTTTNTKSEYAVAYSATGTAQSPSWQVNLQAACTAAPAPGCTFVDVSGTNASGVTGNFPVYGTTDSNCATFNAAWPSLANNAYGSDGAHLSSCGQAWLMNGFLAARGW